VHSGFDAVLLALPAAPAAALLKASRVAVKLANAIAKVDVAPCWTLMVAYPNASQPGVPHLGPQWNAARSTHHRAAWLARESSKPGRDRIERWTLQASAAWSQEHLDDDSARVQGKLLKAFADITGIRATPAHAETYRWLDAQTIKPLGQSHLWDAKTGIGVAGDWCIGHRVEDAFVSGLELALAVNG
jgi:renalase